MDSGEEQHIDCGFLPVALGFKLHFARIRIHNHARDVRLLRIQNVDAREHAQIGGIERTPHCILQKRLFLFRRQILLRKREIPQPVARVHAGLLHLHFDFAVPAVPLDASRIVAEIVRDFRILHRGLDGFLQIVRVVERLSSGAARKNVHRVLRLGQIAQLAVIGRRRPPGIGVALGLRAETRVGEQAARIHRIDRHIRIVERTRGIFRLFRKHPHLAIQIRASIVFHAHRKREPARYPDQIFSSRQIRHMIGDGRDRLKRRVCALHLIKVGHGLRRLRQPRVEFRIEIIGLR